MSLSKEAKAVNDSIDDQKQGFALAGKPMTGPSTRSASFVLDTAKPKKIVHFAPLSSRLHIKYFQTPPTGSYYRLYYSVEEQESFLDQLIYDVMEMEDGIPESEDFTIRGLEVSTAEGKAQSIASRDAAWDAVLREQFRQWDALPPSESCDEQLIAQASLELSKEAGERAHLLALQDQEDVYGNKMADEDDDDSLATLTMEDEADEHDSLATLYLSCSSIEIETRWDNGGSKSSRSKNRTPRRYNKRSKQELKMSKLGVCVTVSQSEVNVDTAVMPTKKAQGPGARITLDDALRNGSSKGDSNCAFGIQWPSLQTKTTPRTA